MRSLLLGLDIGSSSIKSSVVNADTGSVVCRAQSPDEELPITALNPGWAEQDPQTWWEHTVMAVRKCLKLGAVKPGEVTAIGISYQMHGLVVVDKELNVLRPSIIWCDSRAVDIGEIAARNLGSEYCLGNLLNTPGNFTASKLKWVKENEPDLFDRIHKFMLPGDYIALKLTGEIVTTETGLSEAILWDFVNNNVSSKVLDEYGIPKAMIPEVKPVFSLHGQVAASAAQQLGLRPGIPVSYRAGDQPNNAFSLNVLKPGETAATAGTSGVIYSVTGKNIADEFSRVNTFVHVSDSVQQRAKGVLLCINGTGILNSWLRKNSRGPESGYSYGQMNQQASQVKPGADGLVILPFGNGSERILQNKMPGASMLNLDFNKHTQAHVFRAAQEGIVFAMKYGFDILQSLGLKASVIRSGHSNMFLSQVFREVFVNTMNTPLQLYNTDGATGAAIGAGIGNKLLDLTSAFRNLQIIEELLPDADHVERYDEAYQRWNKQLKAQLEHSK